MGIFEHTRIRLLHRFGGFQCGKTFLIDRIRLIDSLEAINSSDEIAVERGRRAGLADELVKTRRLTPGRNRILPLVWEGSPAILAQIATTDSKTYAEVGLASEIAGAALDNYSHD